MNSPSNPNEDTIGEVTSDLEIIDLQPDVNIPEICDLNDVGDPQSFLTDLIGDDSLYSRYLSGQISFDELMREMHRKETHATPYSGRHEMEEEDDDAQSETEGRIRNKAERSDPDYRPRTRHRKKSLVHPTERHGGTMSRTYDPPSKRKGGRKRELPIELAQYLGEAERCLNSDQFNEAEQICKTIIEADPDCPAPYIVLAEVYYRQGDQEKARELLFSAAERNPSDTNLWLSLIEFAEEKNDLALATYYTRLAMRGAKSDVSIRQRLIQYCEKAGRSREALKLRLNALSITPEANGDEEFKKARAIADEFFKLMDPASSIRAYEAAFEKYPDSGTDSDRNTVLSMMLKLNKHEDALKFLIRFCGVSIRAVNRRCLRLDRMASELKKPNKFKECSYPDTLPPELCLKLFLVMVRLGLAAVVTPRVQKCFSDKIAEKFSDWLLDIAKSYRAMELYSDAVTLFLRLTKFKRTMRLTQVWMSLGELYVELGEIDKAIKAYRWVVDSIDPRCADARVALGGLLRRIGKHQEALDLLNPSSLVQMQSPPYKKEGQSTSTPLTESASVKPPKDAFSLEYASPSDSDDDDEAAEAKANAEWLQSSAAIADATLLSHDPVAYRLAYERCKLLDRPDSIDSFLDETWDLLFTDVARLCGPHWAELSMFLDNTRLRSRLMGRLGSSASHRSITDIPNLADGLPLRERQVSSVDVWSLFLRLVELLMSRLPHSLTHLETATIWASLLPQVYHDEGRRKAVSNLLISSCLIGRQGTPALIKLKELQKQWGDKNQYWNVLNLAITLSRDSKHSRFLDRLFTRETGSLPVGILANNDCLVRGSYRYAIARLVGVREAHPNNPLIALLLAICFIGVSLHKFIVSRHPAVLQGLGFLNEYRRARGHCQEVYYNIGRACHQLMLGHVAMYYYQKVLDMEPVGETEEEKSYTDLRKEAAYNLILLYRSQGNLSMARYLMQKYLVI
ncbi:unnamed protein product [Calicophoron daubneyi]|uniref:General transcription factor 3C polypeptide 3 n=1 Tax=Calicophoron daubneyi TaxID=300641 RepID=A0AAV2TLN1_CALDB